MQNHQHIATDILATSPVVLCWLFDSPRTGCAWRTTPYIYVARTSNNRVMMACELYYCLLPRCEALRTCRSGFPIATKWCCDQDVEVVQSSAFTQKNVRSVWFVVKRRGCCCNLSGGVALTAWFTTNGMCVKNNTIHVCGANKQ